MPRIRSLLVGLVALSMLALAAPVAADGHDVFFAESSADGVSVSVLGQPAVDLSATVAVATPDEAAAMAVPAALGGEGFGERVAESDGETVRDPGDPADACEISVPGELSAILSLELLCGEAEATGNVPDAWAEAGVGEVGLLDLGDEALAEIIGVLRDLDLDGVLAQVMGPIEDGLGETVDEVFTGLSDGCEQALGEIEASLLDPLLDPLFDGLDELFDASPDELADGLRAIRDGLEGTADDFPAICATLLDFLESGDDDLPVVGSIGSLLDALEEHGDVLLAVELLSSASEVTKDGELVSAWAGADPAGVELNLFLDGLAEAIESVVGDAVQPLLDTLNDAAAALVEPVDVPVLSDVIDEVLAQSGTLSTLLTDDLLNVAIGPGDAAVDLDLATGEFEGDATASLVELGGALIAVSDGLDELVGIVDGEALLQLRESPLADVLSVELAGESVTEAEVGGLPGLLATSGTANVTLLAAAEGGVVVDLAASSAGIGHDTTDPVTPAGPDPEPVEPEEQPLPVTGGAGLLLGLLALGGVNALRRRD